MRRVFCSHLQLVSIFAWPVQQCWPPSQTINLHKRGVCMHVYYYYLSNEHHRPQHKNMQRQTHTNLGFNFPSDINIRSKTGAHTFGCNLVFFCCVGRSSLLFNHTEVFYMVSAFEDVHASIEKCVDLLCCTVKSHKGISRYHWPQQF